jgi:hypothetical protein
MGVGPQENSLSSMCGILPFKSLCFAIILAIFPGVKKMVEQKQGCLNFENYPWYLNHQKVSGLLCYQKQNFNKNITNRSPSLL